MEETHVNGVYTASIMFGSALWGLLGGLALAHFGVALWILLPVVAYLLGGTMILFYLSMETEFGGPPLAETEGGLWH